MKRCKKCHKLTEGGHERDGTDWCWCADSEPEPEAPFVPINVYSNWCYIDRLNDNDIVDGEPVEVKWPDGTIERHKLRIDNGTMNVSDHGHDYAAPNRRSYIEIHHHGATARLDLRDQTKVRLRRV
jgi:hypothetical protein